MTEINVTPLSNDDKRALILAKQAGGLTPDGELLLAAEEADTILRNENVYDFFLKEFKLRHIGDDMVLKAMLSVVVCPHIKNSFGLHPKMNGEKGSGKSSAVYAAADLIDDQYVIRTSFSAKGLFYNDIPEGAIIISDDMRPNDDIIEIMKRKMGIEYHRETVHTTVGEKHTGSKRIIPAGVTFILTSVSDSVDDQLIDRQWVISVDKNKSLDSQYSNFLKEGALNGFSNLDVSFNTKVCKEITRILKNKKYNVVIPYAEQISFNDVSNRRAMNTFIDLIRCSAAIHHMQRTEKEGVLFADKQDFKNALDMMGLGEQTWSAKLSKPEQQIFEIIVETPGINQTAIATKIKKSAAYVSQVLHGDSKFTTSGLASKAPLICEDVYYKDTGRHVKEWKATAIFLKLDDFAVLGSTT